MSEKEESYRRAAIRDIHCRISALGMDDEEYREMLEAAYGARSSKELTTAELRDLRARLRQAMGDEIPAKDEKALRQQEELTKWRRRVYAVIAEWLRTMGYGASTEAIRTIACRAARREAFCDITLSQLKQIYHSWTAKRQTAAAAEETKALLSIASMN